MVKRRFNNLRAGIANNTRVPPKTPKKSLYELRERAKKIVETAKKTPEEQPIISKKHDLRVKPPPSTPCLSAKMILMSMACFQNILSTFQSGHSGECQRKITVETTVQKYIIFRLDSQMNSKNRMLEVKIQIYSKNFFRNFFENF